MYQQGLETVEPLHTAGNECGLTIVEKSLVTVTSPQDSHFRNSPSLLGDVADMLLLSASNILVHLLHIVLGKVL